MVMISMKDMLLGGLLAVTSVKAQITSNTSSPDYFEKLERHWSYERSPAVYPSRKKGF
jgi:hypothetical protein